MPFSDQKSDGEGLLGAGAAFLLDAITASSTSKVSASSSLAT